MVADFVDYEYPIKEYSTGFQNQWFESLKTSSVWLPPPEGILELNTDVAVRSGRGLVVVGAVIRDCKGLVVASLANQLVGFFEAEVGEFVALKEGVLLAKRLGLKGIVAKVDASNVAMCSSVNHHFSGLASWVVMDITGLFQQMSTYLS
ncbi:hypothetical protein LWI29_008793 [Acer saccharum]|uniref:RNase H type-1 domain-containing protein n=1 Tax=Acer saccharum TaxID=4024 RepID=A0AA39SDG6_ACESA|nr:hypothetical protein LWI29_008793 [Acer saccharum]